MTKTKMYGLKWNGFFCPSCKRKSIVHCLKAIDKENENEDGEIFPKHLVDKLCEDRSQYCMNCEWWGIINDF